MGEDIEHRAVDLVGIPALRHREVALRVEVDREHAQPLLDEGHAEVERRRRLRDAPLLVRERDHPGHCRTVIGRPRVRTG